MKALKTAEKKKKAAIDKEKKDHEKKENKKKKKNLMKPEIKAKKLTKEEFLINSNITRNEVDSEYTFGDYSDDEHEVFEESKEQHSEAEFLTPIQFSSVFGRRQAAAALSTSTPNLSTKHPGRRPASSPSNNENQKKLKNKSLLPLKLRNHSR